MVENAKEYKREKVEIAPSGPAVVDPDSDTIWKHLKNFGFKEDRFGEIEIELENSKYLEYARTILRKDYEKEREKRLLYAFEMIEKGERIDPDNAIYNYLRANLYFDLNKTNEALEEIRKGIKKKYLTKYAKELIRARAKVLKMIDFPWSERSFYLLLWYDICGGLVFELWKKYLNPLAKEYEDKKEFEKAEEIYKTVIEIARQYKEDAFFLNQEKECLKLEKICYQALEKLYEKTNEKEKLEEVKKEIQRLDNRKKHIEELFLFWCKISTEIPWPQLTEMIVEKGHIKVIEELWEKSLENKSVKNGPK